MFGARICVIILHLHFCFCDWVSEWMSPIQDELYSNSSKYLLKGINDGFGVPLFENENVPMVEQIHEPSTIFPNRMKNSYDSYPNMDGGVSSGSFKIKLAETIQVAKMIAETLKMKIKEFTNKENFLKDAIVNGRYGISTAEVSTLGGPTKSYMVRDGVWSLCRGVIRHPKQSLSPGLFNDISAPQCMGQEIISQQDPCAFNSVIKYETVPTTRRSEYYEDDFLCLKSSFNSTLERYMSVPRQTMGTTCLNGILRHLDDHITKCSNRMLSEYTYYPFRETLISVPLEYCVEPDGSCKLTVAWHVSNTSIENFEFLKTEYDFKKYFLQHEGYNAQVI